MLVAACILCAIGALIQGLFIFIEHKENYVLAVILKGSASLFFIMVGVLAFIDNGHQGLLILIGLILGGVGDVLLNLRYVFEKIASKVFLAGVASFLIGHILYLIAIINSDTPVLICVIVGIIVAAICLVIIFKVLNPKLSYKIFGILYLGAVSLMASCAIGNFITNPCVHNIHYAVGAFFFFISDIVLIFNSFGKKQLFSLRITNLTFYYLGQLLIAISMFSFYYISC